MNRLIELMSIPGKTAGPSTPLPMVASLRMTLFHKTYVDAIPVGSSSGVNFFEGFTY